MVILPFGIKTIKSAAGLFAQTAARIILCGLTVTRRAVHTEKVTAGRKTFEQVAFILHIGTGARAASFRKATADRMVILPFGNTGSAANTNRGIVAIQILPFGTGARVASFRPATAAVSQAIILPFGITVRVASVKQTVSALKLTLTNHFGAVESAAPLWQTTSARHSTLPNQFWTGARAARFSPVTVARVMIMIRCVLPCGIGITKSVATPKQTPSALKLTLPNQFWAEVGILVILGGVEFMEGRGITARAARVSPVIVVIATPCGTPKNAGVARF